MPVPKQRWQGKLVRSGKTAYTTSRLVTCRLRKGGQHRAWKMRQEIKPAADELDEASGIQEKETCRADTLTDCHRRQDPAYVWEQEKPGTARRADPLCLPTGGRYFHVIIKVHSVQKGQFSMEGAQSSGERRKVRGREEDGRATTVGSNPTRWQQAERQQEKANIIPHSYQGSSRQPPDRRARQPCSPSAVQKLVCQSN